MITIDFAMFSASADPATGPLGVFFEWANADTGWERMVIVYGALAQVIFFCRWLVQWVASERRGESHIPEFFWWLSLSGATLLLIYYILRHEPVGILGQCTGWLVYSRNLFLIRKKRHSS